MLTAGAGEKPCAPGGMKEVGGLHILDIPLLSGFVLDV